MALLYFNTSALVKRYYQEAGTERVDELIDGDDDVVISSLAIIETVSAFRRKSNQDELSMDRMNGLLSGASRGDDRGSNPRRPLWTARKKVGTLSVVTHEGKSTHLSIGEYLTAENGFELLQALVEEFGEKLTGFLDRARYIMQRSFGSSSAATARSTISTTRQLPAFGVTRSKSGIFPRERRVCLDVSRSI